MSCFCKSCLKGPLKTKRLKHYPVGAVTLESLSLSVQQFCLRCGKVTDLTPEGATRITRISPETTPIYDPGSISHFLGIFQGTITEKPKVILEFDPAQGEECEA